MNIRCRIPLIILALAAWTAGAPALAEPLVVGGFSLAAPGEPPQGWEPLTFDDIERHTAYETVRSGGKVVIRAKSDRAASGLIRRMEIDPARYPVIEWRWRAENVLKKGNVREKSGDDYPARIYITFKYDSDKVGFFGKAKYEAIKLARGEYPPLAAINYVWGSNAPEGTMIPNPYTDKVMMFVVESGTARLGRWVTERRNVREDYRKAFGAEPPAISGVAVMTDTDNTGESATAYYGEIRFLESGE